MPLALAMVMALCSAALVHVAPPDRVAAMRAYLDRMEALGYSGQVLVAEHGKVLLDQSIGLADVARGVAVTSSTRFPIASLTKPMTAIAVMALEQDGKLSLGDSLGRFFAGVPADRSRITIEQLLTHTSGLRRDPLTDSLGRDDAVRRILAAPLRTGERAFSYSNAGYELLAAIVERVTGEPFDAFVRQRVFEPAGMTLSGFLDEPRARDAPLARGYRDGQPNGLPRDPAPGWKGTGSGSAYSTADDLLRWHLALLAGRILPAAVLQRMRTPRVDTGDGTSYGYGWFVAFPGTDSTLILHGGDTDGFHSEFRWYTREDQLFVLVTNQDVYDIDGGAVAKRLILRGLRRALLGRPDSGPPAATALTTSERGSLTGRYDLANGDRLDLVTSGANLWLECTGSSAAAAFLPPADTLVATQRVYDERARVLVKAVATGDTLAGTNAVDRADLAFAGEFLRSEFADNRAHEGEFRGIAILGTAPLAWDPASWRTYAVLRYSGGTSDLFLGRTGGALNDCTSGAGFLHALTLPVARLGVDQLVAYDLLRQRAVPIALERDAKREVVALVVGGLGGGRAVRAR